MAVEVGDAFFSSSQYTLFMIVAVVITGTAGVVYAKRTRTRKPDPALFISN